MKIWQIVFVIGWCIFPLLKIDAQFSTPQQIDAAIKSCYKTADRKKALELCQQAYSEAERRDYYKGQAQALRTSINIYLGLGEQQKTIDTAQKLYKLAKHNNDKYQMSQALIGKALAYAYLGFFDQANSYCDKAEKISNTLTDNLEYNSSKGQIYATRSEILNLQYASPNKRLENDLKSLSYYENIKSVKDRNGWLSIQYTNIAYTYNDLDEYDKALYYNRKAYSISKTEKDTLNQAFAMFGMADAFKEIKKMDSAIYYFKKALHIFEKADDIYRMQYIYEDLSNLYKQVGDDKQVSYYATKFATVSDSIRKKERIETDAISSDIVNNITKGWFYNLYFMIGVLIIIVVIFSLIIRKYFIRYKIERKRRIAEHQQLIQERKEFYEKEKKVNESFPKLVELAKKNDSSFLCLFKEVYPDFYEKLTTRYPDLTKGQIEFCAQLRLNFSTKEIATYSNISVRSVEMRKNRLRKLLKIDSDVDLYKWMMEL